MPKTLKNSKSPKKYIDNVHDFEFDINNQIIYYKDNNKKKQIIMGTYSGFEKNTNNLVDIVNVCGIPQVIFEKKGKYKYVNFEPNAFYRNL